MVLKKKRKELSDNKKKMVKKKVFRVKKPVKKKPVKKPVVKKLLRKKPKENIIGIVTHYFPKVRAGVVKLKAPLAVGDLIKIKGHTTDFTQTIKSIQIDHVPLDKAKKGDEIGLLVDSRVRRHDELYTV
jgi:translation elongation factor EF-1alpha